MTYQTRSKRITIPMEKSRHIKNAAELFTKLGQDFAKIYRSPNSEMNKLFIAQMAIWTIHNELKTIANEQDGDKYNSVHYKNAR